MMLIEQYLSKDFGTFETDTLAKEALQIAQSFDFSHIFLEKDGTFLGAIHKHFLEENPDKTLEELSFYAERFSILEGSSALDGVKLFHTYDTNIIPVIDKNEVYQGYLSWENLVGEFAKYPFFSEAGALLTVEISRKNYSMSEISQIVESNNSKFYGAFISEMNEDFVRITMRISHENLSSIDETFERYGYTIIQKSHTDEKEELLKNRYQFMQKYLEF